MSLDLDRVARVVASAAVVIGGVGIGWGFWESHEAAQSTAKVETVQHRLTMLVHEHIHDLELQQAENHALSGAVLYVEESVAAICATTHANCPHPPGAFP